MYIIFLKSYSPRGKEIVLHPQMQTDAKGQNKENGLINDCQSFGSMS